MPNRSRAAWLVIAASLLLLGYVLLGASDEDEIVARLKELASAVETKPDETNVLLRTARIKGAFEQGLAPSVRFSAPELGSKSGIRELAVLAGQAPNAFGSITIDIGATDVHVDGALAHAVSQVTLTGERGGELRRDRRSVRFELQRSGGAWRVSAIEAEPKSEEQPEARP